MSSAFGVVLGITAEGSIDDLKYPSTIHVRLAADVLGGTLIPLSLNQAKFSLKVHLICGLLGEGNLRVAGENSLSERHQKSQGESMVNAR
jgi:hypothetical protein